MRSKTKVLVQYDSVDSVNWMLFSIKLRLVVEMFATVPLRLFTVRNSVVLVFVFQNNVFVVLYRPRKCMNDNPVHDGQGQ